MKQTAIEWFIEKIIESGHLWVTDTPSDMTELGKLIEQAKQMEKTEIVSSYNCAFFGHGIDGRPCTSGERYYQETFKKD